MRTLVAQEFPQGPISKVNEGKLNRDWESLNRIANNEYRDRFPRKFAGSTVFDWDLEALKLATSNEGLDTINNEYKKRLEEYFYFKHLNASKFQNEFMKSSFLPKYEPKIVRISALYCATLQGRNLTIFGSYFGRNDDFINPF